MSTTISRAEALKIAFVPCSECNLIDVYPSLKPISKVKNIFYATTAFLLFLTIIIPAVHKVSPEQKDTDWKHLKTFIIFETIFIVIMTLVLLCLSRQIKQTVHPETQKLIGSI